MAQTGGQLNRMLISAQTKAEAYEQTARQVPFWQFRRRARMKERARRARATEARLRAEAEGRKPY